MANVTYYLIFFCILPAITAPTVTLPQYRAVYYIFTFLRFYLQRCRGLTVPLNIESLQHSKILPRCGCLQPEEDEPHLDKTGRGIGKQAIYEDVLYGQPLKHKMN